MSQPPPIRPRPANVDLWEGYLDELYEVYMATIIRSTPNLWGLPVRARYQPAYGNKGFSFWHLISEGKEEEERTPDPRRCERIEWVRWAIDCAEKGDNCVRHFRSQQRNRTILWAHEVDYAVVVEFRQNRYMLISAYQLREHRRAQFEAEWKKQAMK